MVDLFKIFNPIIDIYYKIKHKTFRISEINHWKNTYFPKPSNIKKISGTFIYQVPPDYPGASTLNWKKEDWILEFLRLKKLGIDTVIHNGAIAETTRGEWYIFYKISDKTLEDFKAVKNRRKKNPIIIPSLDFIVDAAEETGMKLHLGLFNVLDKWYTKPNQAFINLTRRHEISIAHDLINLYADYNCLRGWYISPEIMWVLHGFIRKLDLYAFLKPICDVLKSETKNKLIGISPGSNYFSPLKDNIFSFWVRTLKNSGVDLIYPQDSIGNMINKPKKAIKIWKSWKNIANASSIKLWANCETFERMSFDFPNPLYAAPFQRLLWQLESSTPYVEKIITWEALYFLNPNGAINAEILHKHYRKFFNLLNNKK